LADVSAVSAGDEHTCVIINADKSLWCWGNNYSGQLGIGTMYDSSPTATVKVLADVSAVSAGYQHTCAIKTDKSLWCWGDNDDGQLGIGSTLNQTEPVKVLADVSAVSAKGGWHTCAIKTDKSFWCWGSDAQGQVGDVLGNTDKTSPTEIQFQTLIPTPDLHLINP
jgi:alpha-tubulin suppressor-like RCC1 family protein